MSNSEIGIWVCSHCPNAQEDAPEVFGDYGTCPECHYTAMTRRQLKRKAPPTEQPDSNLPVLETREDEKITSQPVEETKVLIADDKENVWRDNNGDIWEPIRARPSEREISDREAQLIDALRDCASALDHMMGDSDLPEDDSFQFKACQKAYALLNAIDEQGRRG